MVADNDLDALRELEKAGIERKLAVDGEEHNSWGMFLVD